MAAAAKHATDGSLNIDDFGQLLQAVEQQVALFESLLVLEVFSIRPAQPVCYNWPLTLIDLVKQLGMRQAVQGHTGSSL